MNVVVSVEYRFDRTPDGHVWTQTAFGYDFFWAHYLRAFASVTVVARVRDVPAVPEGWKRADGPNVAFSPVPYYVGPLQYAMKYRRIARALRDAVGPGDAVILRVPSQIGSQLLAQLPLGRPFALQVVGDPYDVFAPGSVDHPLRPFFRWWFSRRLREQCARSVATAYVTRETLQRRYPTGGLSTSFSDVQIPDEAIVPSPRPVRGESKSFELLTVGSLEQLYKAPDVQIDAVAACVARGFDVRLTVIGDGRFRPSLEARAEQAGLGERVTFLGQLPAGRPIRQRMDGADLFLLPSRTEGLPRALIEAMARAMPCIGSTVGGIPELLPEQDLVPPGDADALARKIVEVLSDPHRMAQMSARNLQAAGWYKDDLLRERRARFYGYVREQTEKYLAGGASPSPAPEPAESLNA